MTTRGRRPRPDGVPERRGGRVLVAALLGALLGAAVIMISPITPWTTTLVITGIVLIVPSAAVLVVRLLRSL